MTSAKNIKKLIRSAAIDTNQEVNEMVLKGLLEELDKAEEQDSAAGQPGIRRIIMKSKVVKLAAAAVIIVVVAVGLMLWLPGGKPEVKIPPELANKPIEELLEIHFGKTASTYDSSVVAAAVAKALDTLTPREIWAIGQKYGEGGGGAVGKIAEIIASLGPALSEMVEACDFVAHVRADRVDLDVSDLKAAIIHKQRNRFSDRLGPPIKTTVQLDVLGSHPSLPSLIGEKIHFTPLFNSENINLLEEGKEYLIALQHQDGLFWLQKWRRGVYPVDSNSTLVANLRNGPMLIDDVWAFIMDAYDAIHEGALPSGEILDSWLAKLQSDDVTDCLTAVEYFNTLAEPIAPPGLVMDAMERFLSGQIVCSEKNSGSINRTAYQMDAGMAARLRRPCFVLETLELLSQVADEATVERMLALYRQKQTSLESMFSYDAYWYDRKKLVSRITRIALKHPGPQRRERFTSFLSQLSEHSAIAEGWGRTLAIALEELGKAEGQDIDQLFLDMLEDPAAFGIHDAGQLQSIWEARAPGGGSEIRSRKQAIQRLIDRCKEGQIGVRAVLDSMKELLEPEDAEFIPFLREALASDHRFATLIADVLPDPCFIPVLRAELEKGEGGERFGELLSALHACGEEQAIEIGLAHLEEPVNDVDPQAFMRDYEEHDSIIRFIGTTGDESCVPVLEDFTREELLQVYRQCGERFKFSGGYGGGLRLTAILSLGRLGSESAIPRLKELYESDDIQVRMHAALSLYSLGDDTGYELLEHFVNGTEFSLAQFQDFGGAWPWLEVFEPSVVYLRSPGTDELLLESYRSRHFHPRPDYDWADRIQHETYTFARQYERQLLPILVKQLNNRNRVTRKYVDALLRRLTDQDFGFRADKYVLQQTESIEGWGAYVDDYLARDAQPVE